MIMIKLVFSFAAIILFMIHFSSSVQDSQSTPYEGPFEDDARSDSSAGSEDDGDASISDSSGQISYGVRESAAETLNSDAVLAAEVDQFITSGNWDVSTFHCSFFHYSYPRWQINIIICSQAATVDSDVVRVAEIDQLIKSGNWDVSTFNCIFQFTYNPFADTKLRQ